MTSQPAIEIRQLSKTFRGDKALAPIDLTVPAGSILALVGPNGAGKTTLIKLLLNIIPATAGEAFILGKSTSSLSGKDFTQIGYISEKQELPGWMSVRQFMDYLRPFYPTWDEEGLFAELDLPPERKLKHLSRGMQMKAMLASVLAFGPSVILMDEPFSGLDPVVRDELIQCLVGRIRPDSECPEEPATTILISSHDLGEIESFATHVAFLQEGKLLFVEPLDTLITRFREVTVTLPQSETVRQRMSALPEGWICPESSGSVARFIHMRAHIENSEEAIRRLFPEAEHVQEEPMSLRTIFLGLAKANGALDRNSR